MSLKVPFVNLKYYRKPEMLQFFAETCNFEPQRFGWSNSIMVYYSLFPLAKGNLPLTY